MTIETTTAPSCSCDESLRLRSKLGDVAVWAAALGRTLERIHAGDVQLDVLLGLRDGAVATVLDIQQLLGLVPVVVTPTTETT